MIKRFLRFSVSAVCLQMKKGEKNWVFCDGYLPPKGNDPAFEGHEALMLTNLNEEKARIELVLIFEDRQPETGIFVELDGMRTVCLRMDEPLGSQKFVLDESVQYTVWVKSDIPVCACFGRLDVRQTNMAYYSPAGYSF